jgi:hypothetical protein
MPTDKLKDSLVVLTASLLSLFVTAEMNLRQLQLQVLLIFSTRLSGTFHEPLSTTPKMAMNLSRKVAIANIRDVYLVYCKEADR